MHFDLSIVIPLYNEEKNILPLYQEIKELNVKDFNVEIILVNNGSNDGTKTKIEEVISLHNQKSNEKIIIKNANLIKNLNYDGGIYSGLSIAKGNFLSWTHGDLQTPIKDVIDLFDIVKNKSKFFAKGFRINDRGRDFLITEYHQKLASIILGFKMRDINAQPKMIKKEDFHLFNDPPKSYTCIDTYFYYKSIKMGLKIYEKDVIFKNRIYGQSKWKNNIISLIMHLIFNTLYLIKLRILSKL